MQESDSSRTTFRESEMNTALPKQRRQTGDLKNDLQGEEMPFVQRERRLCCQHQDTKTRRDGDPELEGRVRESE